MDAGRVIAIDRVPERLRMAEEKGQAEVINFEKSEGSVYDRLMEMTGGRGPDRCIDAVGAEAHATGSFDAVLDKAKAAVFLATDRAHVLREAIMCCRKGGTVSIPGVYIGMVDRVPMGAAMNKGLTLKMGQTHVPHYHHKLLERIEAGEIDPSFVIVIPVCRPMRFRQTQYPRGLNLWKEGVLPGGLVSGAGGGERRLFVYAATTSTEGSMKRSDLLRAAVLGLIAVAVQAAEPEFNKECAMGLGMKKHIPTDCSVTWTSDKGKVYCFGSEEARKEFLKAPDTNIAGAETFWSP